MLGVQEERQRSVSGALSKENISNVMTISSVGRSTVYNFLFVCMC